MPVNIIWLFPTPPPSSNQAASLLVDRQNARWVHLLQYCSTFLQSSRWILQMYKIGYLSSALFAMSCQIYLVPTASSRYLDIVFFNISRRLCDWFLFCACRLVQDWEGWHGELLLSTTFWLKLPNLVIESSSQVAIDKKNNVYQKVYYSSN